MGTNASTGLELFHHGSETEAARGHTEFGEAELFHDGFVDGGAGEHDVGAFGRQAGNFATGSKREAPEMFDPILYARLAEPGVLNLATIEFTQAGFHSSKHTGGAAGGDEEQLA